jgi:hypothetical protein
MISLSIRALGQTLLDLNIRLLGIVVISATLSCCLWFLRFGSCPFSLSAEQHCFVARVYILDCLAYWKFFRPWCPTALLVLGTIELNGRIYT